MPEKTGLTSMQQRAIVALLDHPTDKAAAESIGITDRTIRTYKQDPAFKAAYAQARQDMLSDALDLVQVEAVKSLLVIVGIRDDTENLASTRLKAAHILGSRLTDIKPVETTQSDPLQGDMGVLVSHELVPYLMPEEMAKIESYIAHALQRKEQADKDREAIERKRQ